ncbi:MAG: two-component regulator propeller domain-containing protein [Acidobacteriota bacterium]
MAGSARALALVPGSIEFTRVAIPDDVPAHLASALAQDRRGFLWIGTQGGLVRYDGYRYRVFRPDPADPASLGGSYVRTLMVSHDGRVWAGTFGGGVSVWDPASERFTQFRHDPRDPQSLAYDRVEGLAEDRSGAIWVATGSGLDLLDPRSGHCTHFRHRDGDPSSLAHDRVRGLLVDTAGTLWVGSRDGLQRRRPDGSFERVASDPRRPGSLAGEYVERLFLDHRGRLWIGTAEHGAAILDPRSGELRRLLPRPARRDGLSHFWVYGFAEPRPDEIWIATFGGGVDVVDGATLEIVDRLRSDPTLPTTIGGDRVGSVLVDRSGLVWVGTWGQGLAHHDPATRAFRALRFSPNRPEGLTHPSIVRALALRDGTIWAGTNGNGIDVLDRVGRRIGGYRPEPHDPAALADGAITCLAQGPDDSVWVATLDGDLYRHRPGARRFERITPADGLPGGPIRALTFGPDGILWAGAAQGLARVEPTLAVRAYRSWPGSGASPAIEAIVVAEDGALWVGSDNGLFHFDPRTGSAVRLAHDPAQPGSLPDNWVPDLLRARDGRLWVATAAGVCVLRGWDGKSARCDPVAGESSPAQTLIEDDQGWIWIGPRRRVDPRGGRSLTFGLADGCAFRTFFIASRSRMADGSLLFGSPEGLLIVQPALLAEWTFAPPVVATAVEIQGRQVTPPAAGETLLLASSDLGFRVEFAALDFTAPERNRYRYRLSGEDRDWIAADAAQRSASYRRVAPGDYELVVQGSNRVGRWSSSELRLPVRVLPAFYQTAWFRTLVVLAAAGLLYGGYRLRVRQLEARQRELAREVALRTRELAVANRELESAYRRIEEASLTDPLTGLRNRRFLEQAIDADVAIAARAAAPGTSPARDLVFLLLDLDHFKSVNDTHGHAAGDAVLVELANLLRATFRASDHLVRWGGEEFLVVVRFVDREAGAELAEKLRATVSAHPFELPDGTRLARTVSIGWAAYPFLSAVTEAVSWEDVVDLADRALYAAKRSGRDAWVGILAGPGDAPADGQRAAQRALTDPASAAASGVVRVEASSRIRGRVVWQGAAPSA